MTNREIERVAARLAAHYAARAEYVHAEDAWYRWSAEQRLTSPAAKCLFEQVFEAHMASFSDV
jgi:hypothetical protein